MIIAIDGPASSGKGTIAKLIAQHFNLPYLNTGALYRKLAFEAIKENLDLENDEKKIIKLINRINISELESEELHNENIGKNASIVAKNQNIRSALQKLQKDFANQEKGSVMDGRDMASVICPNADHKFFITASLQERAKRRYLQLSQKNPNIKEEDILTDLKHRDERDQNRSSSPLIIAPDAIKIDSSELTITEVFNLTLKYINQNV